MNNLLDKKIIKSFVAVILGILTFILIYWLYPAFLQLFSRCTTSSGLFLPEAMKNPTLNCIILFNGLGEIAAILIGIISIFIWYMILNKLNKVNS